MDSKCVLIADDNDDVAQLLADVVSTDRSYVTVTARDGAEALDVAAGCQLSAAILDISMPRMGGVDAARNMHQRFGERRPLLIALTGGGDLFGLESTGLFDHVLRKPVDCEKLFRKLEGA